MFEEIEEQNYILEVRNDREVLFIDNITAYHFEDAVMKGEAFLRGWCKALNHPVDVHHIIVSQLKKFK